MIRKGVVLFGVQNLQKSTGRIPLEALCEFVYLIQDNNRIHRTGTLDALHNPARHSADIGSAVSPDFGFIPDSAQTDPDIFSSQRLRDAFAHAGFSGTGRTHQKEDRAGLAFFQCHDGNLLDNPVLYFLQTVMIPIQNFSGIGQIGNRSRIQLPFQAGHEIKIVLQNAALRICRLGFQIAVQGTIRLFAGFLRHIGSLDFFLVFILFGRGVGIHALQLFLEHAHLLPDRLPFVGHAFCLVIPLIQIQLQVNATFEFSERLLNKKPSFLQRIGAQKMIFFILAHVKKLTECGAVFIDGMNALDILDRQLAALYVRGDFCRRLFQILQKVLFGLHGDVGNLFQ